MATRLRSGGSSETLSSHYSSHADLSGGSSHWASTSHTHAAAHAYIPGATNHARNAHRHHPYEVPQYVQQQQQPQGSGRRTSPVEITSTPSPISTDDSSELPPHPPHHHYGVPTTTPADNYEYCTPSTSPFLHAVRNMNMKSRTSSRVQSRAPSPVPLHLPPAVVATSPSLVNFTTIGRGDRQHRSHRSHPSLSSPQDSISGPSELHQYYPYPYPHSHGGSPPGTPAPLTMMMNRQKRSSSGGVAIQPSKHSINTLLSGGTRHELISADATSSHFIMDGATALPTPSLSSSSNSSTSGKKLHHFDSASDTIMSAGESTYNSPPLSFPPPPSRSSLASSASASPETTIHNAFASLPPLIPGLPAANPMPSTSTSFPTRSASSPGLNLSSPSTPNSSHSHLAHSVRIAFGMTPIHPPNYFSGRGRSTIGFGNSSVRGSARSQSPPIILPPLKLGASGARTEDNSSHGSEDGREEERGYGHADVKLPHLDSLTRLVGVREPFYAHSHGRAQDDMDVDDLR